MYKSCCMECAGSCNRRLQVEKTYKSCRFVIVSTLQRIQWEISNNKENKCIQMNSTTSHLSSLKCNRSIPRCMYVCMYVCMQWRIYIQKFPARAPPTGPNSFIFTYVFTEKHLCRRLVSPPTRVGAPPNRKSWIRPWYVCMYVFASPLYLF